MSIVDNNLGFQATQGNDSKPKFDQIVFCP
jgi:hypothetical protein